MVQVLYNNYAWECWLHNNLPCKGYHLYIHTHIPSTNCFVSKSMLPTHTTLLHSFPDQDNLIGKHTWQTYWLYNAVDIWYQLECTLQWPLMRTVIWEGFSIQSAQVRKKKKKKKEIRNEKTILPSNVLAFTFEFVISLLSAFDNYKSWEPWKSNLCYSMGRFSLCFFVNSSAFFMNFFLSLVYSSANSGLSGCSGSGSLIRAIRELTTATAFKIQKCIQVFYKF